MSVTNMLPLFLLFLASAGRAAQSCTASTSSSSKPPSPQRKPATVRLVKPKLADIKLATAAPLPRDKNGNPRSDVAPSAAVQPIDAAAQAAVNQVIVDALNEKLASKASAQAAPATPGAQAAKRTAADAAAELRDFLRRTHKYGSKKSPVPEVKRAQADMGGLAVDGIVGPKTRARAAALGAKLP